MTSDDARQLAVTAIREECQADGVRVKRIILFGSQARGHAGTDSDWDFLVCTASDLPFPRRAAITTRVQRRMAVFGVPVDLVLKSEERLRRERGNVGVVSYYALRDGVPV
jgi:predicted nucleotidyltransferase